MKMKIRKGDRVQVMRGAEEDKDKVGEVIRVLPKENRVVVQGVNLVKKHKRLLLVHARTPLGIFKDSLSHSTPAGQHLNGRPKVALRPWLPGPLYSSM